MLGREGRKLFIFLDRYSPAKNLLSESKILNHNFRVDKWVFWLKNRTYWSIKKLDRLIFLLKLDERVCYFKKLDE